MVETVKILGKQSVQSGKHTAEFKLKEYTDEEMDKTFKFIGDFGGSSRLTSIVIPPCADAIAYSAFWSCPNLTKVMIYGNRVIQLPGGASTFEYLGENDYIINPNLVIRVPNDMVDAYKADTNWSALSDHIVGF